MTWGTPVEFWILRDPLANGSADATENCYTVYGTSGDKETYVRRTPCSKEVHTICDMPVKGVCDAWPDQYCNGGCYKVSS